MSHQANGSCLECAKIFNRYPGFHQGLRDWFSDLQREVPEAHISAAGRGEIDQEAAVQNHSSHAHWGHSAHNFNAAIDIFQQHDGKYILDPGWFKENIAPHLNDNFVWYGAPGSKYYELPHVEVKDFEHLQLSLVE